jgi:hypothetical protein
MTARQYGDAGTRGRRAIQDDIAKPAARMNGNYDVMGAERDFLNTRRQERYAFGQARPRVHERLVQPCARRWNRGVDNDCLRGRIIQQQHRVCEKTVPTSEIDDAPAAAHTPHASRRFPGFEELLARQATRATDGSGQAMEECVVGKTTEIVIRQPVLRGWIELHALVSE